MEEATLSQKPCKCGNTPRVMRIRESAPHLSADVGDLYYYVECDNCHRIGRAKKTIEEAVEKWNSYVSSPDPIAGR